MFSLNRLFGKKAKESVMLDKDAVAKLLNMSPEALEQFERSYQKLLSEEEIPEDVLSLNAKQAAAVRRNGSSNSHEHLNDIKERIVAELLSMTQVWEYDGHDIRTYDSLITGISDPVTNDEIKELPEDIRPQLTGTLAKFDISEPSYPALLWYYMKYLEAPEGCEKDDHYHHFRQGLDILDLDAITYEIIGMNKNSIGHWLPQLTEAVMKQDFFRIPKTKVIKVPLPMLQLTRLDYASLTRTTLDIVDQFSIKAFDLDENSEYFVKTGTFSSKFDFRNAYVHGPKEVRELGEYLLFIHHQACQMASPLNTPCIYGVSTTNEWVVREFISDTEGNPCIYKGLPLHTEYRIFVDFDSREILGISPYWDPEVMKQRFGHEADADSPHNIHDYITYASHEKTLMKRYDDNKDIVIRQIRLLMNDIEDMHGQWSIDIMQNGSDFYIIDMALAVNSALNHCVPKDRLKKPHENWIPAIENSTALHKE